MYLVWKRHDCFFSAFAARYCAFVPFKSRREKQRRAVYGGIIRTNSRRVCTSAWNSVGQSGASECPHGDKRVGQEVSNKDSGLFVFYLQIVEDEEKGLCGEALVELHRVGVWGRHLVVVWRGWARVPWQVLPMGRVGEKKVSLQGNLRIQESSILEERRQDFHHPNPRVLLPGSY